ncbi:sulfotransferase family protein [Dongia deserti]|uniref:sulfotransferase family protein n=1 Tax=Dongia deserti TaxID=2268030 RepID=UPI0013C42755|nr:sulfotransferase [Dongia deserti]
MTEAPRVDGHRFLFIGGLHRSGTSIIHRLLREHPDASGLNDTPAPEDEGQHLQSVFPPARMFGGPGRFAFAEDAHMIETSDRVSEENRRKLLCEWGPYYDFSKKVLLEKSPPNLIRSRFLQAMFPGARFIFVVRHPIAVSCATRKWSNTHMLELLFHWCVAHQILMQDLQQLDRAMVIRYEDFVSKPHVFLKEICHFTGLESFTPRETVSDHNQEYFARWKNEIARSTPNLEGLLNAARGPIAKFGYRLSEPFVSSWTPEELERQSISSSDQAR